MFYFDTTNIIIFRLLINIKDNNLWIIIFFLHFPSHPLTYKQSLSDNSATQKSGRHTIYILYSYIFYFLKSTPSKNEKKIVLSCGTKNILNKYLIIKILCKHDFSTELARIAQNKSCTIFCAPHEI